MLKLNNLQCHCYSLGLKPIPTRQRRNPDRKEISIKDCLKVLQPYYLAKKRSEGTLHPSLLLRLGVDSPMLATLYDKIKGQEKEEIWNPNNKNWLFQEKIDGIRAFLVYTKEDNSFHVYGRELSEENFLPMDFTNKVDLTYVKLNTQYLESFILDCELFYVGNNYNYNIHDLFNLPDKAVKDIVDSTGVQLVIYPIDCIYTNNDFIHTKKLSERRELLEDIVIQLASQGLQIRYLRETITEKETLYNTIKQEGGEGIIAKNLNSPYVITGKRSEQWIKLKNDKYIGGTYV